MKQEAGANKKLKTLNTTEDGMKCQRIFESENLCGKQLDLLPLSHPRERQEVYSLERT